MKTIIIQNLFSGGLADSLYSGLPNSVYACRNLNLHETPGLVKVNQALAKENGATTIDDLVKKILPCSDGNTYLFGSTNGKIWKRTSAGVYSLVATASPAAGSAGILDAYEYQGYIYYAMQSRLGRVAVGAPTAWAGRNDSWATFTTTDADFHPMKEVNAVLYIGDGNLVAQVDAGAFTADALDIYTPHRIKSLGKIATDLLIGTYVNAYRVSTGIFRWNTWSESWSVDDEVPEIGINSFLSTDNFVLVSAGRKGSLYLYNGSELEQFKKIPGDWSGSNEAVIHPNATCNMNGLPLFGLSNVSGNPAPQGIYSLGGYDRNYNKVLNLEYIISTGNVSGVDIGAVVLVGTTLLVSWKDTTGDTTYGIGAISLTAKASSGYFETRQIVIDRSRKSEFSGAVGYKSLPTNCSIEIWYKNNHATDYLQATVVVDTDRKIVYTKEKFPEANTIQFKVILKTFANTTPEVESAQFEINE